MFTVSGLLQALDACPYFDSGSFAVDPPGHFGGTFQKIGCIKQIYALERVNIKQK